MVAIHRSGITMSPAATEFYSDEIPAISLCCIPHVLCWSFAAETQLSKRWLRGKAQGVCVALL